MPELPEVETIRRDLDARLGGARIESITVSRRWKTLRHTKFHENRAFERRLRGATIQHVERRSKYLLITIQPTNRRANQRTEVLLIHLGMSGQLRLVDPKSAREAHTHAILRLDRNRVLRFTDPRTFGRLWLVGAGEVEARIGALGPEPLSPAFTWRCLAEKFIAKRAAVKSALLDMRVVAGLGNIYSDEALFAARIHPLRPCCSLSRDELRRLTKGIKLVLRKGVRRRGTTLDDARYTDPAGACGGNIPRVYGRADEPCPRCRARLTRLIVSGRSAHYCPQCQQAAAG